MNTQLRLDASIYSVEAAEKASYRFIDRFSTVISHENQNLLLDLTFDEKHATKSEAIIADFKKELLDQNLRVKIKKETKPVRDLILSYTFSKTEL